MVWHCHIRDRLPLDVLTWLPAAIKSLDKRKGQPGAAAAAGGVGNDDGDEGSLEAEGSAEAAAAGPATQAAVYQFRPQVKVWLSKGSW
jgi:hypothetical protein